MALFERMIEDRRWLYRPWIPFLKAVEGGVFARHGVEPPVLDLACGDGTFAAAVYGAKLDAGLDLDLPSLKRAAGKYSSLTHADAASLPFADNSFQTVISACALEHIEEVRKVLAEVRRVLRPGGKFIFSVPSTHYGELLLRTRLLRALGMNVRADEYVRRKNAKSSHIHIYPPEKWEELLREAGFTNLSCEYALSPRVMLVWSFMTSFIFKLFFLPFRSVREVGIGPVDSLLRAILKKILGGLAAREGKKDLSSGGYLILVTRNEQAQTHRIRHYA